jgi:hypothetical protein
MPGAIRLPRLTTPIVCVALALLFAIVSLSAALTKSATIDEPLHVAAAYSHAYLADYRVDAENPPLWKYWAMLAVPREMMRVDAADPLWRDAERPGDVWAVSSLYRVAGVDGSAVVNRAREMMVLLGAALCLLTAWWARVVTRRDAGVAACVAAGLFALDPTFLAHAPIVKNDVAMSLLMLILVIALWRAGKRLTVTNAIAVAAACAVAMNVKFSGVLFPVIAGVTLPLRAIAPRTWNVFGRDVTRRGMRFTIATGEMAFIAVVFFVVTWGSYGFRYSASSIPGQQIDFDRILANTNANAPTDVVGSGNLAAFEPTLPIHAIGFANRHRLLPESYLAGMLNLGMLMRVHQNYLFGHVRDTGWPFYFELAMMFKTPIATLVAAALTAALLIVPRTRRALLGDADRWAIACAAIAIGTYFISTVNVNLNSGVRHMLPVYPLLFVLIAVVAARAVAAWPRAAGTTVVTLFIALAVESLAAYPNFIPFFNVAAGGQRGGLHLLGDSNLDWGQDLPLVAKWQREHPDEKLYFCYFGAADPGFYGIRYTNLPGGFILGPPAEPITTPGVVAMSVTRLQGINTSPQIREAYARLRVLPIRESLGGSIYLYDYPPPERQPDAR